MIFPPSVTEVSHALRHDWRPIYPQPCGNPKKTTHREQHNAVISDTCAHRQTCQHRRVRQLLPVPIDDISADVLAARSPVRRPTGRPWIALCMIASTDGATATAGRSGGLSSSTDTAMLLALRRRADMVLVGAATVRAEGYGSPSQAGLRIGVVSSRGDGLDFASPLFASGAGFVITTTDAPDLPVETVRCGHDGHVDLADAVGHLDVGILSVEGGARLNAALLDAGLVDEINLTTSPHLVGGESARLMAGARERPARLELAHLAEHDDYLFARYNVADSLPVGPS